MSEEDDEGAGAAMKSCCAFLAGADRDFVLAAVANSRRAIVYASPELWADRDVVMAAVANDHYALQYASSELRSDRDLVIERLKIPGVRL